MNARAQSIPASAGTRHTSRSSWRRWVFRLSHIACVAAALIAIVLYVVSSLYWLSFSRAGPRRVHIAVNNGAVHIGCGDELLTRWDPLTTRVGVDEVPPGPLERPEYPPTWNVSFFRQDKIQAPYPFLVAILAREGPRSQVRSAGVASFLDNQRSLAISLLAVALAAAFPPFVAGLRKLAGRVRSENICGRCGFDMRATPGRCPECGLAAADQPPRSAIAGRFGPPLVALALILIVALVHAATAPYPRCGVLFAVGWSYSDHSRTALAPESAWSSSIWVDHGALLLAYTAERDWFADTYPTQVAAQASPPLTGLGWLEPAFLTVPTSTFGPSHLLRVPLWIVLLALGGGVWWWISRVRRHGGFYFGRIDRDEPVAPASSKSV